MRNLRLGLVIIAMMSMSLMAGNNEKSTQSYGAWLLQNAADWQSQMTKLQQDESFRRQQNCRQLESSLNRLSGKTDWTGALDPEVLTFVAIKCMQAAGHTAQFIEEEVVPVAQEHAGKILVAGSVAAIMLAKNIASKS